MIPKKIFQTYKVPFDELRDDIKALALEWKDKNPNYEYYYYSDADIENFVIEYYGKDWHKLLTSVPFGVIKADIFRYLAIYKFGGVYTDLDTKCVMPIDDWVKGLKPPYKDYDAVFGTEIITEEHPYRICQWTFAAKPGLPVFKKLIENVYNALYSTDWSKIDDPEYAIYLTCGPIIFSYSILSHLDLAKNINGNYIFDPRVNLLKNVDYLNNHKNTLKNNFYFYGNENLDIFYKKAAEHLFAGYSTSKEWNDGWYFQWKQNLS